ncbi:MAG: branched-chain amino acid ABC transporter substrate-binding protein [Burkholderiales bacterium]|nr:branched-chain amino acid ABC transporter substrate-binding protein [Burkholderiales bacterium]
MPAAGARRRFARRLGTALGGAALGAALASWPLRARSAGPAAGGAAARGEGAGGAAAGGAAAGSEVARGEPAARGEPIRLAMIEGFSGAFANAGDSVWRNLQFAVERVNARGGVRVGGQRRPFLIERLDSKGQVEEAIAMLRRATDARMPFVLQGNSSTVAAALLEGVAAHNERMPGSRVLFLNYAAVDPALTNERCSFWHFRFDAHAGMRMSALADALARNREVRRVYLLNQDYSFGRQVASLAREMIAARRPDIEIVGDELHPLGRIKDFVPYAAKIQAAGADTVVTGNWGNDLTLLVRAAREIGLGAGFYTFYGNGLGAPAAIGEAGIGRVHAVAEWHPNAGGEAAERIYLAFRRGLRDARDDYFNMRHVVMIEMLAASIEAAGSTAAVAVARALEGREHRGEPYPAVMRAADHQLFAPLYVSVMQRAGPAAGAGAPKHDLEGSGFGFRTELRVEPTPATQPHGCAMKRPGAAGGGNT